ncbi:MAG: cation diffusion facilitator family transporter [Candidatus Kariarchaeaceae archaeon]|jgi:cation diffusion facilitator family transporter
MVPTNGNSNRLNQSNNKNLEYQQDDSSHGHHHHDKINKSRSSKFFQMMKNIITLGHSHDHDHDHSHDFSFDENTDEGIRAVKISFIALMITAILQIVVVIMTGSVALLADTIHNFSDALTSIPLFIAYKLSKRANSKKYTYGYGRAEDLSGLLIVFMISMSAFVVFWESIDRISHPKPIENLGILALAAIIGFIGNEIVAQYRIGVGKKINSEALVADGLHSRTDGLTSLSVLFGAIGVYLGYPIIDPIIGILIGIMILSILKESGRKIWHQLMDVVDPVITTQIEEISRNVEGVKGVHNVKARWSGRALFAECHIIVNRDFTVDKSHMIIENIRKDLHNNFSNLAEVIIHPDPCSH